MQLQYQHLFLGSRSLGTFLDGGDFDSRYFLRNRRHFEIVKERLTHLLNTHLFFSAVVSYQGIHYHDGGIWTFRFHVDSQDGLLKLVSDFLVRPVFS